jgi:hypothetical protein
MVHGTKLKVPRRFNAEKTELNDEIAEWQQL